MDEKSKYKIFLLKKKGLSNSEIAAVLDMHFETIENLFKRDEAFKKDYEDYGLMFIKGAR